MSYYISKDTAALLQERYNAVLQDPSATNKDNFNKTIDRANTWSSNYVSSALPWSGGNPSTVGVSSGNFSDGVSNILGADWLSVYKT
jgi:hypothetical protein